MGSLDHALLDRSVFANGPEALIPDTVSIAVACMKGSPVPEGDLVSFIRNIHTALLDIARQSLQVAPELKRLSGTVEVEEAPTELVSRASEILNEAGLGLEKATFADNTNAEAQKQIESSAAVLPQPAFVPKSVPAPRTKAVKAVQESFLFTPAVQLVETPSRKAPAEPQIITKATPALKKKTAKVIAFKGPKLPRKLKNVEDALTMKSIICLEDGKKVKDLGAHLAAIGVSPDEYRKKWKLPPEYPLHSPDNILSRGATFEVDFVTGNLRAVRKA